MASFNIFFSDRIPSPKFSRITDDLNFLLLIYLCKYLKFIGLGSNE